MLDAIPTKREYFPYCPPAFFQTWFARIFFTLNQKASFSSSDWQRVIDASDRICKDAGVFGNAYLFCGCIVILKCLIFMLFQIATIEKRRQN